MSILLSLEMGSFLCAHPTGDKEVAGKGGGATMHHPKSCNYLSSFSVASSCVDYLCQLAVDTSSPDDPVGSAAEIVC